MNHIGAAPDPLARLMAPIDYSEVDKLLGSESVAGPTKADYRATFAPALSKKPAAAPGILKRPAAAAGILKRPAAAVEPFGMPTSTITDKHEIAKQKKRLYSRAYHGEETRQVVAGESPNKKLCREAGLAASSQV